MSLTLVLERVLGIYLIIMGLVVLFRRRYFTTIFAGFIENKVLRALVAIMELIAGILLVVIHNKWISWPTSVISLVGWIMAIEGLFYLILPEKWLKGMLKIFNNKFWYFLGGLLAILVGIYLAYRGFYGYAA